MDRDNINNGDQGNNNTTQSHWSQQHHPPHRTNSRRVQQSQPHQTHPPPQQQPPCPRCSSTDTKFGYYNNYNLTQPRYFCKGCKRYWTHGGALRNVPVGGGSRKTAKRPRLSPPPNTTTQPPHELSRFGILNPAKVLEIGEGSALSSVPVTTAALSISPPTSSTSSLAASPLMINYLNPNYPHLSQGEDRHNGFFTSLIEFQGMNAAPSSQPFFTPPPAAAASASASVSSKLYNLGPLFHFSPFPAQEPPGWRRQSFLTAAAGEHHQVFNQPPGRVPVTSVEDGALVVKDDEVGGRSSGCSEKGTDQQPDASKYGRDGNQ